MTAPAIIRADGVDWPLDTFIDAYRLTRVDRFDAPPCTSIDASGVRVQAVTRTGELIADRTADALIWGDIIAYRPVEGTRAATPCLGCDQPVMRDSDAEVCEACEDLADEVGLC